MKVAQQPVAAVSSKEKEKMREEEEEREAVFTEPLSEIAFQFFGFSPYSFCDTVHNVLVDSWTSTVEERIMCNEIMRALRGDHRKAMTNRAISYLFPPNIDFNKRLDAYRTYVLQHVFAIPPAVTLPEHETRKALAAEMENTGESLFDVRRQIRKAEEKYILHRVEKKALELQVRDANDTIAVLLKLASMYGVSVDLPKELASEQAEWMEKTMREEEGQQEGESKLAEDWTVSNATRALDATFGCDETQSGDTIGDATRAVLEESDGEEEKEEEQEKEEVGEATRMAMQEMELEEEEVKTAIGDATMALLAVDDSLEI